MAGSGSAKKKIVKLTAKEQRKYGLGTARERNKKIEDALNTEVYEKILDEKARKFMKKQQQQQQQQLPETRNNEYHNPDITVDDGSTIKITSGSARFFQEKQSQKKAL